MLRNLLHLFILFFASNAMMAQVPGLPKPVIMFMKKTLPTQKTNSQSYRLIAQTNLMDEGTGFDYTDSTTYVYKTNSGSKVDSSYTYQWMGSSWEPQSLEVTQYNAQGQAIGLKGFFFAGPGWEQDSRGTVTYDANNNLLTMVYEEHDGSAWDTTVRFENTYANNLVVEETMYQNQGSGLEPVVKTLYSYNAQDLLDTSITQMYMGSWVGMDKAIYTYNAAGLVLTKTTQNGDFMGGFENATKEISLYNLGNHLVQFDEQLWNGNSWDNDTRTFYQVNTSGKVLDYLIETWDGTDWQETRQVEYFYTGSLLDSSIQQQKLGSNWVNEYSNSYTYDANGNETIAKSYNWNGGAWELTTESHKYYEPYNSTGIGHQPAKLEGLSVYPNPIESVATFSFTAEKDGIAALAIYDLAGRQLFAIGTQTSTGHNVMHWDAGSLPSGSYIYKLKVDGKTATGVLVK